MTQQLEYTFTSSSTDPFDDWFADTRGTELEMEDDVDECEEDDYSEDDYE